MMTATNRRDRETVRSLLRQCLPSGFPENYTASALTVGDVACKLKSDYATGRLALRPADVAVNANLLADATPIDGRMTTRRVNEIRETAGLLDGSDHYWERFRRAAVGMLMARGGADELDPFVLAQSWLGIMEARLSALEPSRRSEILDGVRALLADSAATA